VSGWSDGQVRTFAKQIAGKYQPAWFLLAPEHHRMATETSAAQEESEEEAS